MTGEARFLHAAEEGARHLLGIAHRQDGDIRIQSGHPHPDGLFYLGWCHGPAGTSRLFYRLWTITGRDEWRAAIEGLTRPILTSGIPEVKPPGYWNKIGRCCGSAGIAEYLWDLASVREWPACLDLAIRLSDDLLDRGLTPWWRPSPLVDDEPAPRPVTGLMHGAAGLAMWLLRLSRSLRDVPQHPLRLPDSPWPADGASGSADLVQHARVDER